MSTFKESFLRENIEHEKSYKEKFRPIVKHWQRSGLLDKLNESDQYTLSMLLQNQAKQIVKEASRTSTAVGSEEWADIALPMVRKVFAEQLTRELVHSYSQDKPNGLVFYLDFELDVDKPEDSPIFNKGESVYGVTETENDPSGSFYGSTRYGYSNNYQKASTTIESDSDNSTATGKIISEKDVQYDPSLVTAVDSNAADSRVGYFDIVVDPSWNIDFEAPEVHTVTVDGFTGTILRQFTKFYVESGDTYMRFLYVTETAQPAIDNTNAVPVVVHYVVQPTAYDRGDYEQGQAGVNPIDEVNIKITQREMVAKTRKMKTTISPEMIQDLDSYHQMDAQKEVINILSGFIESEEDQEILAMLSKAANNITRYWSARVGEYVNSRTGAVDTSQSSWTMGINEWYKQLGVRVRATSNDVHKRNLRGGLNWMVTSPSTATVLESFNTYQVNPEAGGGTFSMGVKQDGTVEGGMKIYKNPYWKDNEILMGFKGDGFLEAGAAYGTYIPFQLTPPITSEKTFDVIQGLVTRNSKIVLRSDYFAKIYVSGLETL